MLGGLEALYRQHSNPASDFVYHDQRSGGQVGLVLIEGSQNRSLRMLVNRVNRPYLISGRTGFM